MSRKQTDVKARVRELEATVRGLTQEVVEANERIHKLEEALDGAESRRAEPGVRADGDGDAGTKQMGGADEGADETATDLDDIIVA
jgi:hypothetical protein